MLKEYFILTLALSFTGCTSYQITSKAPQECNTQWYSKVDALVMTDDGQGHGPDQGTNEWKNVVLFQLGLRGDTVVPSLDSDQWCEFIDNYIE